MNINTRYKSIIFVPARPRFFWNRRKNKTWREKLMDAVQEQGLTNSVIVETRGLNTVYAIQITEERPCRAAARANATRCTGVSDRGKRCSRITRDADGCCAFHKDTKKRKAVDLGFELADHP